MSKKGNTKLGQALIKSLEEALEWTKGKRKLRVTERKLDKALKHTDNLPDSWFDSEETEEK